MKKTILILIAIIFFLLIITEKRLHAQNSNSAPTPQASPTQQNLDAKRIDILEAKLDSAEKYNDKILNVIYWAVGALGTAIFFVLALNIFNNNRNFEQIKNEMEKSLREDILAELRVAADVQVGGAISSTKSEIKALLDKEVYEFRMLRYEWVERNLLDAKTKKIYGIVIIEGTKLLELALELEWASRINESIRYLSEAIEEGKIIKSRYATKLLRVLDAVPSDHNLYVEKLRQQIVASTE